MPRQPVTPRQGWLQELESAATATITSLYTAFAAVLPLMYTVMVLDEEPTADGAPLEDNILLKQEDESMDEAIMLIELLFHIVRYMLEETEMILIALKEACNGRYLLRGSDGYVPRAPRAPYREPHAQRLASLSDNEFSRIVRIGTVIEHEQHLPSLPYSTLPQYRMSKAMFSRLHDSIKEHPVFHKGGSLDQFPSDFQLMIALDRMAHTGSKCHRLALQYNVSEGYINKCTKRAQIAIVSIHLKHTVTWPDEEEREELSRRQQSKVAVRGCIGYIDGCLIPLKYRPTKDGITYWTRKACYALNIMGVCDIHRKIRYLHIGFPGSAHDNRVVKNSRVVMEHQTMFHNPEDPSRPYWVLGDSGYSATPYLIPIYRKTALGTAATEGQEAFSKALSSQRIRIEHVFGLLKIRWESLQDIRLRYNNAAQALNVATWINCCAVLHNILMKETEISRRQLLGLWGAMDLEKHIEDQVLIELGEERPPQDGGPGASLRGGLERRETIRAYMEARHRAGHYRVSTEAVRNL